ncbi:MAG: ABC transporter permease [Bacteroidales bacterium]
MKELSKIERVYNTIFYWMREEYKTIATSYAITLVLLGGIFVYGLLYNYMYLPNEVKKVPVAVVDNSKTSMSRDFIQMLDATPQVSVFTDAVDFAQAKRLMKEKKVVGILLIPDRFEKKIEQGEQTFTLMYETTIAFLYYLAMQKAFAFTMQTFNDQIRPEQLVFLPTRDTPVMAQAQSPVSVVGTPLYNYTEGYGTYLIPAVLVVIIFQTLMMVIAMISGKERCSGSILKYADAGRSFGGIAQIILSKTFVYGALYALFSLFLLGLMPLVFGLPHIGNAMAIIQLMIPFILATSFLGLAASVFYTDPDGPLLMIAFFSVGLLFLSGVSYPLELMPWYWRAAHFIFPVAPATLAFVKVNSMGAGIPEITTEYTTLWIQCVIYFFLACQAYRYNIKKQLLLIPGRIS